MSRREYDIAYKDSNELIYTFTSSTNYPIIFLKRWVTLEYTKMSFFIVGRGGAGTGDFSGSDTVGFGGSGKQGIVIIKLSK